MIFFHGGNHGDLGVKTLDIPQNIRTGLGHGDAADFGNVNSIEY